MRRYWHIKSSRFQKIKWLLNNQHLWVGWQDLGDHRQRDIVERMKAKGLLSEKTYWKDVNLTSLIYEARKVRRSG